MTSFFPTCYHPTRVLLIDDHKDALEQLYRGLDHSLAKYEMNTTPQEVLDQINVFTSNIDNMRDFPLDDRSYKSTQIFANEIYNPSRFDAVSTVVVDYDMPEMTGLEFCQKIKSPHIQKILLTGAADEKIAVKAFNEGIINHYIRKQDPTVFDQLEAYISLCQRRYFQSLHRPLIEFISAEPMGSAVDESLFQDFFNEFIKENKLSEYYLMEGIGSYLCLNKKGEIGALIMYTEERLDFFNMELEELIRQDPEQKVLTPRIIDEMNNRRQIFYFDQFVDAPYPPLDQWHHYIVPLNYLGRGRDTYYWAYIPDFIPAQAKKIARYQKYQ
jgi:CheY-like chemotaxis protein